MEKKVKDKAPLYRFLKPIVGPFYRWYCKPAIIGKELIPKEGPIIVVGNHKHTFDQFNPMISTKRIIHYMAKKEYFDGEHSVFSSGYNPTWMGRKVTKWLVRNAGCISVDRSKKDAAAMDSAIDLLNSGLALGLFPEGTRNKTDALLLPLKFGAVSLASKTNATIVPFGISGDYKFRSKNLKIIFGEPFKIENMSLEEANEKLTKVIGDLILEGRDANSKTNSKTKP